MHHRLTLVTPPTGLVVQPEEVRAHLGLPDSVDDDVLNDEIIAATEFFDGKDGLLGRALLPQTWDYVTPRYVWPYVELPLPPLISVTSISYVDEAYAVQTMDPSLYSVKGVGTRGAVQLNTRLPVERYPYNDDVTIRFTAGYPDSSGRTTVPGPIKTAIIMKLSHMRSMKRADPLLKQDSVIGVSSVTYDTGEASTKTFDSAIESLVARYRELYV